MIRGRGRYGTLRWSSNISGRSGYDFAVWSADKRWEKPHYIHQNPVRRRLVLEPEQWKWSSARYWLCAEAGQVLVNEALRAEMKVRPAASEYLQGAKRGEKQVG